jgi:hypothetical protein
VTHTPCLSHCSHFAGNQAEIERLATDSATRFSQLFDSAKVGSDGKCPEGFSPANPNSEYYLTTINGKKKMVQCLKIKVRPFLFYIHV